MLPPRFEDLGRIAGGASGDVRRIRDTRFGRVLAMKVLRWEFVESTSMRARFFAEAQLTAELQHPGIVAVHDRGELEDGRLWFTMKEVRGRTLGEVVAEVHAASSPEGFREAPSGWTFRRLVDAFARIGQAVGYAHSRGIVHRDLKPDNLMVGEFGEVLVMDWGLARRIEEREPESVDDDTESHLATPGSHVTRHGDVLGTPAYMPPEQARGQRDLHGPESDVYALGAILHQLLAGRPPYQGSTSLAVWRQVLAGPPPSAADAARGGPPVPAELCAICDRAMRREISERYPSAEAHALLADHYREQLADAEIGNRDDDAARCEVLLRSHDRGRHAAFLRGDGALSLVTDPPGAEVDLYRYALRDRRLEPSLIGTIGPTPIRALSLQRGSYLLVIRAQGCADVRYPVLIERDAHWDGCAPGESEPFALSLPRAGELGPDDVYVPAGHCWTGGDPSAGDSLPRRRLWVDGLVISRFPVTNREYLEFLNDLVAEGREAQAIAACPRPQLGVSDAATKHLTFGRDPAGLFVLGKDELGSLWQPDWPVVLIGWHEASAYASWFAARTGRPWRLPVDLEREKAARGCDGRFFPWGNHFDAGWACIIDSHSGDATRVSVQSYPEDESPYGIRGLAGNTRDWCSNIWTREGPEVRGGRLFLSVTSPEDPNHRSVRGGAWSSLADLSRAAVRFGSRPTLRRATTGIRIARAYPG